MKISIFGLGYVGSVTAACLAHNGHDVTGLELNPEKLALFRQGTPPVIEKDLAPLLRAGIESGRLRGSADSRQAVLDTELSMICVGTPSEKNGSLNLSYVQNVAQEIGAALAEKPGYHVVVVRSTVLPGSTLNEVIPLLERCSGKQAGQDFGVCMNPEFLREGSAVADFFDPALIVIGELDARSGAAVEALYTGIDAEVIHAAIPMAEMIKYANNAFHALKVTFANEIGTLCKAYGIDGREVMDALCRDTRLNISPAYLKPGFAFGGSCLPKDLRALLYSAKMRDVETPVLQGIMRSNRLHVERGIELVESLGCKKVGVLGLSFKPDTDDVRESPVVHLIEQLVGKGYHVGVYDDQVELGRLVGTNKTFLESEIPHIASLMRPSAQDVLDWAEVVVVTRHGAANGARFSAPHVIDLVGMLQDGELQNAYEGICW